MASASAPNTLVFAIINAKKNARRAVYPFAARRAAAAMPKWHSTAARRKRAERFAAQERKERWQLWSVIALLLAVIVTFFGYKSYKYLSHANRHRDQHHHHHAVKPTPTNLIP